MPAAGARESRPKRPVIVADDAAPGGAVPVEAQVVVRGGSRISAAPQGARPGVHGAPAASSFCSRARSSP